MNVPVDGETEFEVPGAVITRDEKGEVPGGRWVRIHSKNGGFGFASDGLYNFSRQDGGLQATVVRGTRYADETQARQSEEPWRPVLDAGELNFRFLMTSGDANLPQLAQELEQPPVTLLTPPSSGSLPRKGSLASLYPASLQLSAIKCAEDGDGFVLRAQAPAGSCTEARLLWMGKEIPLGRVIGGKVLSWRLNLASSGWTACAVDLAEMPEKNPNLIPKNGAMPNSVGTITPRYSKNVCSASGVEPLAASVN